MRALGDKISSTIVAQSAQVPTIGWSGSGRFPFCPFDDILWAFNLKLKQMMINKCLNQSLKFLLLLLLLLKKRDYY